MIETKVENAAQQTLGSVPSSWNIRRVAERMERLKPLCQYNAGTQSKSQRLSVPPDVVPPPITYFLWVQRNAGLKSLYYVGGLLSESNISAFEASYGDMADEASLTAELDVDNFVAESEISDVPAILQHSVLSISTLYKYITAQEHSLEFLLSDEMILKAIKELRTNPYLFFSYGEDAKTLMPVKWGDL